MSSLTIRESEGDGYTEISHQSIANSECYIADSGLLRPDPQSVTLSSQESRGASRSQSYSLSRSRSEACVPWYEYHPYQELSSVTFRSLDEQLYLKKAQLKKQPRQHAAVLVPDGKVQLIWTPTLREFPVRQSDLDEFVHECWEAAGCFARPAEAEGQIAAMEEKLLAPPPIALRLGRQDVDHRVDHVDRVDLHIELDQADDDDSDYDRV